MGRRRSENTLSLFAFQDIITGVAGVMMFILLLLVVQLAIPAVKKIQGKVRNVPQVPVATTADVERLRELQQKLVAMRARADELFEVQATRPRATIEQLQGNLQASSEKQQKLQKEIADLQARIRSKEAKSESAQAAREVLEMQQEIDTIEQELERVEDGKFVAFQSAESMPNLWLIDLRRESAELVPMHDPTQSRRIQFSAEIDANDLFARLQGELDRVQADRSVVLLLRPSAARRGTELLVRLRKNGFRIALELLDSETRIVQSLPGRSDPDLNKRSGLE